MNIRPVSDLRNKFPEIESLVIKDNEPVYLTKNGYGSMVILSIDQYTEMQRKIDEIEQKLDEADKQAKETTVRYTSDEVFGEMRKRINEKKV